MQRYRALLEQLFRQQQPLAFYADASGLTADHLSRTCRATTGESALALMHDRVALEARRMLAYTPGSVTDIVHALGFDDPGHLPVGKDFPVFLHPVTHEEYALARTERKTAPGYKGFVIHAAPDVTLEQDLARRDITINSIANYAVPTWATGTFDAFFGEKQAIQPDLARLIDPHNGQHDIRNKVLRHVTDAFREDPVRILRVARFAARFADFSVAPETMQLMRDMVAHGEVDHLVAERV